MAFIISDFKSVSKMTKSGVKVNLSLSHRMTNLSWLPGTDLVLKLEVPHPENPLTLRRSWKPGYAVVTDAHIYSDF